MDYVYKITFPNGKVYIGKSSNPYKRFEEHLYTAKHKLRNTLLYNALIKYQGQTLILDIVDIAEFTFEINWKEQLWIEKFNSTNKLYGYNMTVGGEGGNTYEKISEERKKELSEIRRKKWKEKNPNTSWKKETREKISESVSKYMNNLKGDERLDFLNKVSIGLRKHYSSKSGELHKIKISKQMSGDKSPMSLESIAERNNCSIEEARKLTTRYGKHQSDYSKQVASKTHKGKNVSKETREKMRQNQLKYTYIIINSETNQKWETKNLFKWCKENGIPYSIMSQRAENKQQRSFRKYKEWSIIKLYEKS